MEALKALSVDAIIREVEERSVPAVPFSLVCSLFACVDLLPDLVTLPGLVVNDLLCWKVAGRRGCVWLYSNTQNKCPIMVEHKPCCGAVEPAALFSFTVPHEGLIQICP